MPKQPLIKKLIERRIPQIIGSYFITGTTLVFFIQYLVDRYQFPSYYPTLALFALTGILPSVLILAYFHGAPGKDEWTKVEKIGIPINVLFIAGVLFFGDSMNIWNINQDVQEEEPQKYLIHFTSLYDDIEMYEESKILGDVIKGRKLDTLNYLLLDSIRKKIKIHLLSEYYNSKKEFTIPTSSEDVVHLNNYSLTIGVWGTSMPEADSIFNRFNKPDKIFYINLYKLEQNRLENNHMQYFYSFFNLHCMPSKECISDNIGTSGLNIEKELMFELRSIITKSKRVGKVSNIKEDIISVKLNDMNIREDMILDVATPYNFSLDGYEIGKLDFNNAIKYYEALNDTNYNIIIAGLKEKLNWLFNARTNPYANKTLSTDPFFYKVRVIEVIDSTAITKIYSKEPFVKIRKGDVVSIR